MIPTATREEHNVQVLARYEVVKATATSNAERANAAAQPHLAEWTRRANEIVNSRRTIDAKFRALYALADDMVSHVAPHAACKRGCSHCCHIAVGMMQGEAEVLGRAIGVKPTAKVKHRSQFSGFDFGYHNPCTFLVDGECSIYEHRPLACRAHFNMDADALLCELYPPELTEVPYFNNSQLQMVAAVVCKMADKFTMQDIRTFFPDYNKGRKKGGAPE
jgi:Fe-S-cluster containining protein